MTVPGTNGPAEPAREVAVSTAPPPAPRRWWTAVPHHLGRARTSTVVLALLFVALYTLYLFVRPPDAPPPATPVSTVQPPATTAPVLPTEPEPTATAEPTTTAPAPGTTAPGTATPSAPGTSEPAPTTEAPATSAEPTAAGEEPAPTGTGAPGS